MVGTGLGNPVVSAGEATASTLTTLLAILVPVVTVALLLVMMGLVMVRLRRRPGWLRRFGARN